MQLYMYRAQTIKINCLLITYDHNNNNINLAAAMVVVGLLSLIDN